MTTKRKLNKKKRQVNNISKIDTTIPFDTNRLNTGLPKKKLALGGIDPVSVGLSLATTVASNIKQNQDAKGVASFNKSKAFQEQSEIDSDYLKDYNTSGTDNKFFYKKGGSYPNNVRTTGNNKNFKPIGDNTFLVKGPGHENGGVTLGKNSEVEGGEIIKATTTGTKVLSDDNSFYGYSPADKVKNNPSAFNKEFAKQEAIKGNAKPRTNKYGLGVETDEVVIDDVKNATIPELDDSNKGNYAQYIDNVGNAILSLNTPQVPKPVLAPKVRFDTDYNAEPQLANVIAGERSAIKGIQGNFADANVASAFATKIGNQATASKGAILANKENTETNLNNQAAVQEGRRGEVNTGILNRYSDTTTQRNLGIQTGISQNLGNLSRDLIGNIDRERQSKVDNQRMQLELFKDTEGALDRAIAGGFTGFDDYIVTNYNQILKDKPFPEKTMKAITARYHQLQNK